MSWEASDSPQGQGKLIATRILVAKCYDPPQCLPENGETARFYLLRFYRLSTLMPMIRHPRHGLDVRMDARRVEVHRRFSAPHAGPLAVRSGSARGRPARSVEAHRIPSHGKPVPFQHGEPRLPCPDSSFSWRRSWGTQARRRANG